MIVRSWSKVMLHFMYDANIKSWSEDMWNRAFIKSILEASIEHWGHRCKLLQPTKEDYLHNKRIDANNKLEFYKRYQNRHAIGLYKSLIKHPNGYFSRAKLRTVLQWLSHLEDALNHTKEYRARTQHLITKFVIVSKRNPNRVQTPIKRKTTQTKPLHQNTIWNYVTVEDEPEIYDLPGPRPDPAPNIRSGVT